MACFTVHAVRDSAESKLKAVLQCVESSWLLSGRHRCVTRQQGSHKYLVFRLLVSWMPFTSIRNMYCPRWPLTVYLSLVRMPLIKDMSYNQDATFWVSIIGPGYHLPSIRHRSRMPTYRVSGKGPGCPLHLTVLDSEGEIFHLDITGWFEHPMGLPHHLRPTCPLTKYPS